MMRHICVLIALFFVVITFSFNSYAQDTLKDRGLEQIIQEATLHLYVDPIAVIQVGDSLISNASDKVNEKATGLLLISDAFIAIRNYPQALHYMNDAKALIDEQKLATSLRIKILNRLAYQHFQLNLFNEALEYLNDAEVLNDTKKTASTYYTNKGYTNVVKGLIYRNLVDCEVAMSYFHKSIENYSKSEEDLAKMNISVIYYNIGNCYTTLQDFEKSKHYYELSYRFADVNVSTKNSLKLFAIKGIANYYYATKQYTIAVDTLESLVSSANKIGDKTLMRSIYSDLAANYLALGDWKFYEKYTHSYNTNNKEIKKAEIEATLFVLTDIQNSHNILLDNKSKNLKLKVLTILLLSALALTLFYLLIVKKRKQIQVLKSKIFQ